MPARVLSGCRHVLEGHEGPCGSTGEFGLRGVGVLLKEAAVIVLGIILVLVAAAIALLGVWAASQAIEPAVTTTFLNATIQVSPLVLFLGGALAMVLLWMGLRLLGFGTRRTVGKRRERKELLRTQRQQEKALAETNLQLDREHTQRDADLAASQSRHDEERVRESQLRIESDRRREQGREEEIRRLAAERDRDHDDGGTRGSRDDPSR